MHKYLLFLAAITIDGQTAGHKGIIIQNGKKIIRKQ